MPRRRIEAKLLLLLLLHAAREGGKGDWRSGGGGREEGENDSVYVTVEEIRGRGGR